MTSVNGPKGNAYISAKYPDAKQDKAVIEASDHQDEKAGFTEKFELTTNLGTSQTWWVTPGAKALLDKYAKEGQVLTGGMDAGGLERFVMGGFGYSAGDRDPNAQVSP
jgi:hypothetical protein